VTVQDVSGNIISEDQYSVKYLNNVHAGTASVKVTMTGNWYEGSKKLQFTIDPAANTLNVKGKKAKVSYAKVKKGEQVIPVSDLLTFTDKGQGSKRFSLSSVSKNKKYFEINIKTGALTVKKGLPKGEYKLTISVQAKGNADYKKSKAQSVTVKLTNK